MEDGELVLYGAGDVGREVVFLVEEINRAGGSLRLLGFVDDLKPPGTQIAGLEVLGGGGFLSRLERRTGVVCCIGCPPLKRIVLEGLAGSRNLFYPVLIHPSVIRPAGVAVGEGSIIYPSAALSVGVALGRHVLVNPGVTVGHDVRVGDFATLCPGVHLGGWTTVGNGVFLGIGSCTVNECSIGENVKVGAGAVVKGAVPPNCVVAGVPAKPIPQGNGG